MNYLLDSRNFFVGILQGNLKPGQVATNIPPPEVPEGYKAKFEQGKWVLVCLMPRTEQEARAQRQRMLQASDWAMLEDSPLSSEAKAIYKSYRQALRDLPENKLWPNVVWPKLDDFAAKPEAETKRGRKPKNTKEQ